MNVGTPLVVQDDGRFFLELDHHFPPSNAPGYLRLRCTPNEAAPGGVVSVGSFEMAPCGKWCASISVSPTGTQLVGLVERRMSAITALWAHRATAAIPGNSD